MKIVYEFVDGTMSEIEVAGELAAEYCVMAGYDPEEPPEMVKISEIEELSGRKHTRPHKYTGIPGSLEEAAERGEEVADQRDDYAEIETAMDMERALATLTELQRLCFVEVRMKGRGYREVAAEIGKSRSVVEKAVKGAISKLLKLFKRYGDKHPPPRL